jgi:exopolysaccharide biosynthesis polyprenyl glycosylphosphotransferase
MASELQPLPPQFSMSMVQAITPAERADTQPAAEFEAPAAFVDGRGQLAVRSSLYEPSSRSRSQLEVPATAEAHSRVPLRTKLFLIDLFVIGACWIGIGFAFTHSPSVLYRLGPGLVASAVALVAMRVAGLYRSRTCARRGGEVWRIGLANASGGAAFAGAGSHIDMSGYVVLACMGAATAMGAATRWEFARWLRAQRSQGRYLRAVVLVGCNEDAARLRSMLHSEPELGYRVVAVAGSGAHPSRWADLPSSSSVIDIPHLAAATGANGVLIVPFALSSTLTEHAIAVSRAADLHVQLWPGFPGVADSRLRNVPISGEPFFYVEPRSTSSWQLRTKRAIDIVGAVTGLALSSPLIAIVALLIKLEDHGPIFYRGERVGLHGATFDVFKFRSMSEDLSVGKYDLDALNERTDGPLFKAAHDPRTTKVGQFLRAFSIDELPQLWNVLKGTMSLVGPRPALPSEVAEFDDDLQRRHSLRPGMTGLWQVEARDNPSFNAYRRLDLRYIDNWSLLLDLYIMAATVPAVASHAISALRSWIGRRRTPK